MWTMWRLTITLLPLLSRFALALVSLLLAATLLTLYLPMQVTYHPFGVPRNDEFLFPFLSDVYTTVFWSLPGLAVGLPIILWCTNLEGWRFWAILALGTALGPAAMFFVIQPALHLWPRNAFLFAHATLPMAALTTLIYLVLLRNEQRRSASRKKSPSSQA